jgi:hypothetical protein
MSKPSAAKRQKTTASEVIRLKALQSGTRVHYYCIHNGQLLFSLSQQTKMLSNQVSDIIKTLCSQHQVWKSHSTLFR